MSEAVPNRTRVVFELRPNVESSNKGRKNNERMRRYRGAYTGVML